MSGRVSAFDASQFRDDCANDHGRDPSPLTRRAEFERLREHSRTLLIGFVRRQAVQGSGALPNHLWPSRWQKAWVGHACTLGIRRARQCPDVEGSTRNFTSRVRNGPPTPDFGRNLVYPGVGWVCCGRQETALYGRTSSAECRAGPNRTLLVQVLTRSGKILRASRSRGEPSRPESATMHRSQLFSRSSRRRVDGRPHLLAPLVRVSVRPTDDLCLATELEPFQHDPTGLAHARLQRRRLAARGDTGELPPTALASPALPAASMARLDQYTPATSRGMRPDAPPSPPLLLATAPNAKI